MQKKILTVVGARPQFIKAAAVSKALQLHTDFKEVIVHTGQHFDTNMSAIFFDEMEIPRPDYNLDIHSLSHGAMTGRMLEALEKVMLKEAPNGVMVYGDTNSTIAGALAAKKLHLPVVHVEAGLRSFNMKMPEEINRILTDRISDILFCPTDKAVQNLQVEGFDQLDCRVELVGDVMQDAALFFSTKAKEKSGIVQQLNLKQDNFLLVTIHRAENTNDSSKLSAIIEGLNILSKDYTIVFPMHPRTKKYCQQYGLKLEFEPIEPVGYLDMIQLLDHSQLVITDSGGLQKEAYFFRKYCLTVRDQTEWTELVDLGINTLIEASKEALIKQVNEFSRKIFTTNVQLYGGGKASENICTILKEVLDE